MPIRVSIEEASALLSIVSTGQVMRREVGWAAERARELLDSEAITGVLVDSTQVQKQISPSLSAEMISGFSAAMDTELPIAYVRPAVWSDAYAETIAAMVDVTPEQSRVFTDLCEARKWLVETHNADADRSR
jgi:hypothetical protein